MEHNLIGPVAGSVINVPYTAASNELLCAFSNCVGQPFPIALDGVNVAPECDPNTTVDMYQ